MGEGARAVRIRRVGRQDCPHRLENSGAFVYPPLFDYWELGTWAWTQEEADAAVAELRATDSYRTVGNVLWLYPGTQPRTCSFCSGGHPDDLTALIRAGWEINPTNNGYMRYLRPPGYWEYIEKFFAGVSELPKSRYMFPTPPVVLYVQHFSDEQIAAFNTALHDAKGRARALPLARSIVRGARP